MTRLVSLNVERSLHLDRFVPFLRQQQPDVVCLQELVERDIPAIQAATGLAHAHFAAMALHPADGQVYGVGILARQPFVATDTVTYAGVGDGTMAFDRTTPESRLQSCRYVAACAHLSVDGQELQVATTHFPWTPDGGPRPFQSDAVRRLIDGFRDRSVILTGDFNAPRGGPIFAELAAVWRDWVPPEVTTTSPRLTLARSAWWAFMRCCCGRMTRKYMIARIAMNGTSWTKMDAPPIGSAAPCAKAGEMNIAGVASLTNLRGMAGFAGGL